MRVSAKGFLRRSIQARKFPCVHSGNARYANHYRPNRSDRRYVVPILFLQQEVDILMPTNQEGGQGFYPSRQDSSTISVVIPVYNEEDIIRECHRRLSCVLDGLDMGAEIIYVNDGSSDKTLQILREIHKTDFRVCILELSRNFGKEAAMSAGLDHANGDAVIIMDADLQDPPELIPLMLIEWRRGYDGVYMKRTSRKSETAMKKLTAYVFYRLLRSFSPTNIPADVGDFRLLSRPEVEALKRLPERTRYMKGLFSWIGFSQKELFYERESRAGGCSKWKFHSLLSLSLDGLTSFSITPLKLASYMGLLAAGGAFFYGLWIVAKTLLFGEVVRGYPTMMVVILFLGGIQLIAIGILGEYLGRMFMESKQRPLYLLKRVLPAKTLDNSRNSTEIRSLVDDI